jgi:hypothetical protein
MLLWAAEQQRHRPTGERGLPDPAGLVGAAAAGEDRLRLVAPAARCRQRPTRACS